MEEDQWIWLGDTLSWYELLNVHLIDHRCELRGRVGHILPTQVKDLSVMRCLCSFAEFQCVQPWWQSSSVVENILNGEIGICTAAEFPGGIHWCRCDVLYAHQGHSTEKEATGPHCDCSKDVCDSKSLDKEQGGAM